MAQLGFPASRFDRITHSFVAFPSLSGARARECYAAWSTGSR